MFSQSGHNRASCRFVESIASLSDAPSFGCNSCSTRPSRASIAPTRSISPGRAGTPGRAASLSKSHPFHTGNARPVDPEGAIAKFERRYGGQGSDGTDAGGESR